MKVGELINFLNQYDDDVEVVVSKVYPSGFCEYYHADVGQGKAHWHGDYWADTPSKDSVPEIVVVID